MNAEEKQALIEWLEEGVACSDEYGFRGNILKSMKVALAALTAEPVAYVIKDSSDRAVNGSGRLSWHSTGAYSPEDINEYEVSSEPLYTAPPVAAAAVPDGWKLVPVEMTKEMWLQAHTICDATCPDCGKGFVVDVTDNVKLSWEDMLAAAQEKPQ